MTVCASVSFISTPTAEKLRETIKIKNLQISRSLYKITLSTL